MALSTAIKVIINKALRVLNLELRTLTAEKTETRRLLVLQEKGYFSDPVFPILPNRDAAVPAQILSQVRDDEARFAEICSGRNVVGYSITNEYFTTPDAEVLYSIVQLNKPNRIVEIGSGHSTRLLRQAIIDSGGRTTLTSIDPAPRITIEDYSDLVIPHPLEKVQHHSIFGQLQRGDILFVDSSHQIKAGNDVLAIIFEVIPRLAPGVLIHFHDVFLPYDYPSDWLIVHRVTWGEQYLIQALLTDCKGYEIIWPGYHLQKIMPDFSDYFAQWRGSRAQSFWLRKC